MDNWLNEDLKRKIRKIFEPKYKRPMTEIEVTSIANNLANLIEIHTKFLWRKEYEKAAR